MKRLQHLVRPKSLLLVLLAVTALLSLNAAWRDSQTIDEAAHIGAGYSYWKTADFRLNPEHPPLMKLLAGLFVLPLKLTAASKVGGWQDADQWAYGKNLIYHSPTNYRLIIFMARLPFVAIYLLLIAAVYLLTRRLFGETPGLIASGLIAVDPTFFANGHLVTNDILLCLAVVLFMLTFYNYLKRPGKRTLLLMGLATLLAASAKYDGLVLLPAAVGLIIFKNRHVGWLSNLKKLGFLVAILFVGLWAQYFFTAASVNHEVDAKMYQSSSEHPSAERAEQRLNNLGDKYPPLKLAFKIPLPGVDYLKGLANVASHNSENRGSYLMGEYSSRGWPYYMLLATVFKLPNLVIVMIATLPWLLIKKRRRLKETRYLIILLPVVATFLVTAFSSINIGVRHVLPGWVFIYIGLAVFIARRWPRYRVIMSSIVILSSAVALISSPLAYTNAIAGAISDNSGKPVLIDSNLDWGQDLYRLNDYLKSKKAGVIGTALFTNADLNQVLNLKTCELSEKLPECTNDVKPNLAAVSDTARYIEPSKYGWLDGLEGDRVGGSITVYELR